MAKLDVDLVVNDDDECIMMKNGFSSWMLSKDHEMWDLMLDIEWLLFSLMDQACLVKILWLKVSVCDCVRWPKIMCVMRIEFLLSLCDDNDVWWCCGYLGWIIAW